VVYNPIADKEELGARKRGKERRCLAQRVEPGRVVKARE